MVHLARKQPGCLDTRIYGIATNGVLYFVATGKLIPCIFGMIPLNVFMD